MPGEPGLEVPRWAGSFLWPPSCLVIPRGAAPTLDRGLGFPLPVLLVGEGVHHTSPHPPGERRRQVDQGAEPGSESLLFEHFPLQNDRLGKYIKYQ